MEKFSKVQRIKRINEQEVSINKPEETKTEPSPETTQTNVSVDKSPSKFFSKLFESREMAHIYHLQVKGDEGSYASHIALNSYYEDVIGLIDEMVEIYQGQYDLIDGYETIDTSSTKTKDKIEYFKEVVDYISKDRYVSLSKDDSHLQNIVDESIALIYKLIYKLRFNK